MKCAVLFIKKSTSLLIFSVLQSEKSNEDIPETYCILLIVNYN